MFDVNDQNRRLEILNVLKQSQGCSMSAVESDLHPRYRKDDIADDVTALVREGCARYICSAVLQGGIKIKVTYVAITEKGLTMLRGRPRHVCKQLQRLPPVATEWQTPMEPDCKYFCDRGCSNPCRCKENSPCPFDGKELPIRPSG